MKASSLQLWRNDAETKSSIHPNYRHTSARLQGCRSKSEAGCPSRGWYPVQTKLRSRLLPPVHWIPDRVRHDDFGNKSSIHPNYRHTSACWYPVHSKPRSLPLQSVCWMPDQVRHDDAETKPSIHSDCRHTSARLQGCRSKSEAGCPSRGWYPVRSKPRSLPLPSIHWMPDQVRHDSGLSGIGS
jgi:hypothetical protein